MKPVGISRTKMELLFYLEILTAKLTMNILPLYVLILALKYILLPCTMIMEMGPVLIRWSWTEI